MVQFSFWFSDNYTVNIVYIVYIEYISIVLGNLMDILWE